MTHDSDNVQSHDTGESKLNSTSTVNSGFHLLRDHKIMKKSIQ